MADLIKQLYKKNDSTTKIFPNIKAENIPPSSVSLVKLASNIQSMLMEDLPSKMDATKLDSLLTSIKTSLASYGVDFSYSYANNTNTWTISFANIEQQFDCYYAWDVTQRFVKYQKIGNHIIGLLQIEINEQINANEDLLILDHQNEWPSVKMYMNAWNNQTSCVASIDTDGNISVNVALGEYDVLTIRLDWWV